MSHHRHRQRLYCCGLQVREASQLSLVVSIMLSLTTCIFGMQLWLIILNALLIIFDGYCLLKPQGSVFKAQTVFCFIRATWYAFIGIWLLFIVTYKSIESPFGYYFGDETPIDYMIVANVLLIIGMFTYIYLGSVFHEYAVILELSEIDMRMPVAYGMPVTQTDLTVI